MRFLLLLAAGVAIVLAYVRSGESTVVLVLSLLTFLAVVAAVALRPWEAAGGPPFGARADRDGNDTWRCGYDVVWDGRGVEGVPVGDRLPRLVVWSRIDGIEAGRHRAALDDRPADWRRAVRLTLFRAGGGEGDGPTELWLCLGPDQDPEALVADLDRAWTETAARRWYPGPDANPGR